MGAHRAIGLFGPHDVLAKRVGVTGQALIAEIGIPGDLGTEIELQDVGGLVGDPDMIAAIRSLVEELPTNGHATIVA